MCRQSLGAPPVPQLYLALRAIVRPPPRRTNRRPIHHRRTRGMLWRDEAKRQPGRDALGTPSRRRPRALNAPSSWLRELLFGFRTRDNRACRGLCRRHRRSSPPRTICYRVARRSPPDRARTGHHHHRSHRTQPAFLDRRVPPEIRLLRAQKMLRQTFSRTAPEFDLEPGDERRHHVLRYRCHGLKHGHVSFHRSMSSSSRTALVRRLPGRLSGLPERERRHRASGGGGTDFVAKDQASARGSALFRLRQNWRGRRPCTGVAAAAMLGRPETSLSHRSAYSDTDSAANHSLLNLNATRASQTGRMTSPRSRATLGPLPLAKCARTGCSPDVPVPDPAQAARQPRVL